MTKTVIACIRQAKEDMQSDWKEVERIAASDDCLRIVEQFNDGWKGKACGYKATESIASFHEVAWEGPLPPELTDDDRLEAERLMFEVSEIGNSIQLMMFKALPEAKEKLSKQYDALEKRTMEGLSRIVRIKNALGV